MRFESSSEHRWSRSRCVKARASIELSHATCMSEDETNGTFTAAANRAWTRLKNPHSWWLNRQPPSPQARSAASINSGVKALASSFRTSARSGCVANHPDSGPGTASWQRCQCRPEFSGNCVSSMRTPMTASEAEAVECMRGELFSISAFRITPADAYAGDLKIWQSQMIRVP